MQFMYLYQEGVKACEKEPLKVALSGITIGHIHKVAGGYQMIPTDNKIQAGAVMDTIQQVQQSLPSMFGQQ